MNIKGSHKNQNCDVSGCNECRKIREFFKDSNSKTPELISIEKSELNQLYNDRDRWYNEHQKVLDVKQQLHTEIDNLKKAIIEAKETLQYYDNEDRQLTGYRGKAHQWLETYGK